MENLNFYDPDLHEIIKRQDGAVRINILPDDEATGNHHYRNTTKFAIGENVMTADTSPDCLIHYILEPLFAHYPEEVTIDGRPIEKHPFQPSAQTRNLLMPYPLEGQYFGKTSNSDFTDRNDVGIIIDGITYMPDHASWNYHITNDQSRHEHWSQLELISVYPCIDLGSPTHTDPSHPENIAETISRTMSPKYQVPESMRRQRSPDPESVYESWAPQTEQNVSWLTESLPIVVNTTPAIINVENQALAFTIAHALYNQPELGLVPVKETKPGHDFVTVTCPDTEPIEITDAAGTPYSQRNHFPNPDGPLESITIRCQADGKEIKVNSNFLFLPEKKDSPERIYATGRHNTIDPNRGDNQQIVMMISNTLLDDDRRPKSPDSYYPLVTQALKSTEEAVHNLMMAEINDLKRIKNMLSPLTSPVEVQEGPWTITYTPDDSPKT